MKPTHPSLLLGLALALLFLPACQFSMNSTTSVSGYHFTRQGPEASNSQSGEIPPGTTRVEVEHKFGQVIVEAGERDFGWNWDLHCWATSQELADHYLGEIRLRIEPSGGTTKWILEIPDPELARELRGIQSNLTLRVPAAMAASLKNTYGASRVEGLTEGVTAKCRHGKLELKNLPRPLHAETSYAGLIAENIGPADLVNKHGKVDVQHVAGNLNVRTSYNELKVHDVEGDLDLVNEHGRVDIRKVSGAANVNTSYNGVSIHEVQGDVKIRNKHGKVEGNSLFGNLDVETSYSKINLASNATEAQCVNRHGGVQLELTNPDLTLVDVSSSYSDIQVGILPSVTVQLDARTSYGKINSDFPLNNVDSSSSSQAVSGGDPSAQAQVKVRNQHGSIRLQYGNR